MPRFFCDYCDAYLTHDSAPGRQQHIRGWKHRENFRLYYQAHMQQWMMEQQMKQFQQAQEYQMQMHLQMQQGVGAMPLPPPNMMPGPPSIPGHPQPVFTPGMLPPGMQIPGIPPPLFRAPPPMPPSFPGQQQS